MSVGSSTEGQRKNKLDHKKTMAYALSSHSLWNVLIGHCKDKRAHECKQDQACVGGSSIYSHLCWGYFYYNKTGTQR